MVYPIEKSSSRIARAEESLIFKLYKARYFPFEEFMTTTMGSQPSYSGRSFVGSRWIIERGSRWVISY
ncbi:hypothetical protein TanjilG_15114 [Lupinus angustifolius]|nr:hypothetical protein TanjilG_15114 [Lupinus angustifolius]